MKKLAWYLLLLIISPGIPFLLIIWFFCEMGISGHPPRRALREACSLFWWCFKEKKNA